jgi:anti-sigma-K factor RskA
MNYHDEELIDHLAAGYVVGTLRGSARRRFEGLMSGSIPLRRAVQRWERRLFWLSMQLRPVQPPTRVWTQIEKRIRPATNASPPRLWQSVAAVIATIAVVLGGMLVARKPEVQVQVKVETKTVQSAHTAILADSTAPIWVLNVFPQAGELRVQAMRKVSLSDKQSFELWMLPDSGAPPVSLGLLPREGTKVLQLDAEKLHLLVATSKIAVSIEPAGGSPTGAPTGPIPYVAPLLHTGAA